MTLKNISYIRFVSFVFSSMIFYGFFELVCECIGNQHVILLLTFLSSVLTALKKGCRSYIQIRFPDIFRYCPGRLRAVHK